LPLIVRDPNRAGGYRLEAELWLPRPLHEVFAFFSDAHRLEEITPPWLRFQVRTAKPIPMFAGTIIDYRLRLRGIPLTWQSVISVWEPPSRFVDRQVRGPYRLWHHEHSFVEHDGGTLIRDRIEYAIIGGPIVHELFVRRDLERIFAYRQDRLATLLK
jgi:ligand-binding SRPBCC domain-containing protein